MSRLWTHDFVRMYISNMLLFASLYMLLPVLPLYMVDHFDTTIATAGGVLALFAVSMFFAGSFYNYLIDAYRRKTVCMLAYFMVIAILGGYTIVHSLLWMIVLRMAQGMLFGITTTMGSTLTIDITASTKRSEANTCYSWASRLGMVFGPMIGILLYKYQGLDMVIYASMFLGVIGLLFISLVTVPFRAPMGTSLCSLDRFLLLKAWLPALNLMLVSFVFGMLLTTINMYAESFLMQDITIRFFGLMGVGFLIAMIASRFVFANADVRAQIVSGLILMGVSLLLIITHPEQMALITAAVMLGLGFGLVASDFLLIFVNMSEHCQRGTANTTYLLSWETGTGLGVVIGCYLIENIDCVTVFDAGIVATVLALIMYLTLTHPYYKKYNVR
ncbi:MAG: MFS transporter [Bacteroidaceae bacterium]